MTSDLDCATEIIWHRFILSSFFSYGVIYLFSVPTLAIYYILFQSLTLSLPWHELHKHTRDLWAATSFIICLVYRSSIQKASYNRVEPSFYNSLELLRCEIDDDMSSKASSSLARLLTSWSCGSKERGARVEPLWNTILLECRTRLKGAGWNLSTYLNTKHEALFRVQFQIAFSSRLCDRWKNEHRILMTVGWFCGRVLGLRSLKVLTVWSASLMICTFTMTYTGNRDDDEES